MILNYINIPSVLPALIRQNIGYLRSVVDNAALAIPNEEELVRQLSQYLEYASPLQLSLLPKGNLKNVCDAGFAARAAVQSVRAERLVPVDTADRSIMAKNLAELGGEARQTLGGFVAHHGDRQPLSNLPFTQERHVTFLQTCSGWRKNPGEQEVDIIAAHKLELWPSDQGPGIEWFGPSGIINQSALSQIPTGPEVVETAFMARILGGYTLGGKWHNLQAGEWTLPSAPPKYSEISRFWAPYMDAILRDRFPPFFLNTSFLPSPARAQAIHERSVKLLWDGYPIAKTTLKSKGLQLPKWLRKAMYLLQNRSRRLLEYYADPRRGYYDCNQQVGTLALIVKYGYLREMCAISAGIDLRATEMRTGVVEAINTLDLSNHHMRVKNSDRASLEISSQVFDSMRLGPSFLFKEEEVRNLFDRVNSLDAVLLTLSTVV